MRHQAWPSDETAELAAAIARARIRFLVIGGAAVRHYCPDREAHDLDLLIEPDYIAGVAALAVLAERGFYTWPLPRDRAWRVTAHFDGYLLELLSPLPGQDFEAMWARRTQSQVGEHTLPVVGLEDLVSLKRLALEMTPQDPARDSADLTMLLSMERRSRFRLIVNEDA